ncbi:hypothetical protein BJV82DRAFT_327541 [Fennellomyces sp. T-0311]|nr:hypothetical protein BJV82DRAFT_327541 [Fennellomyces sp. T-0311]
MLGVHRFSFSFSLRASSLSMGLLRFSRKEKPSSSQSSSSTLSCRRIEIPSKSSLSAKDGQSQQALNRDFISSSAFRAIIGEKGSLLEDILSELGPEDTDSQVDLPMPRSSSSTATTFVPHESSRPTPTATKSAVLPSHRQSHAQGFLAQKYMEANNRRQRNPGSSNNRMTSSARPDAWTVDQKRNKTKKMYTTQVKRQQKMFLRRWKG